MTSQNDLTTNTTTRDRRPRETREAETLDSALGKSLFAYALAASVGMIVLPSEAMAKIVYTPTHDSTAGNPNGMNIDLNHDGIIDFNIFYWNFSGESLLQLHPKVSGNEVVPDAASRFVAALPPGAYIGPAAKFSPIADTMAKGYLCLCSGPWAYARKHYLGFEFLVGGKPHFGWARLNVDICGATLTGYAYETVPGGPIPAGRTQSSDDMGSLIPQTFAPESNAASRPATLGLLAQGASGIVAWRREEQEEGSLS